MAFYVVWSDGMEADGRNDWEGLEIEVTDLGADIGGEVVSRQYPGVVPRHPRGDRPTTPRRK